MLLMALWLSPNLNFYRWPQQVDESTDISGHAQLLANVRFIDGDAITRNFLFCKRLPVNTTGEEIFRVTSNYFEQGRLEWKNCISICTDGAAAMVGRYKGFVDRIMKKQPEVVFCTERRWLRRLCQLI